jgi:predicted amidohydrolase
VVEEGGADAMKVTVCELPDDRRAFASEWERLSRHVRRVSSEVVLLPEIPFSYWIFAAPRFDLETWTRAVDEHRRWVGRLSELGATVVLGSRLIGSKGRRFNEGFVWSGSKATGVHHKRYLPDEPGYYEARWYDRGDWEFTPFEAAGWKAGFMICSDLWSMANARSYGKKGVDLIASPRCTGTNVEKWLAGGRVAAVVSGAYCASSNRTGERGDAHFGGGGWIVDPDGEVLALTTRAKPFATVDIDRARSEKAKKTYPRDALEPD